MAYHSYHFFVVKVVGKMVCKFSFVHFVQYFV